MYVLKRRMKIYVLRMSRDLNLGIWLCNPFIYKVKETIELFFLWKATHYIHFDSESVRP